MDEKTRKPTNLWIVRGAIVIGVVWAIIMGASFVLSSPPPGAAPESNGGL